VLSPATDYVAEFTRHVSRAKVVRARSLMSPLGDGPFAGDVPAEATIEEIASAIEAADNPHRVIAEGEPVGVLARQAVIDVLVGRA